MISGCQEAAEQSRKTGGMQATHMMLSDNTVTVLGSAATETICAAAYAGSMVSSGTTCPFGWRCMTAVLEGAPENWLLEAVEMAVLAFPGVAHQTLLCVSSDRPRITLRRSVLRQAGGESLSCTEFDVPMSICVQVMLCGRPSRAVHLVRPRIACFAVV